MSSPTGRESGQTWEHHWKSGLIARRPDWIACQLCGILKRPDGKNGPCKGPVEVVLRSESGQETLETDELKLLCGKTWMVPADFARTLEGQLTAARAKIEELEKLASAISRDCNNTALERNAARAELAAKDERITNLRGLLLFARRVFDAYDHMPWAAECDAALSGGKEQS